MSEEKVVVVRQALFLGLFGGENARIPFRAAVFSDLLELHLAHLLGGCHKSSWRHAKGQDISRFGCAVPLFASSFLGLESGYALLKWLHCLLLLVVVSCHAYYCGQHVWGIIGH